ncbi:hypothetical protein [Kitasatospora sp. NPDC002965]|uniref:hypothetical protein n=1 Tax=Kitasatospora sp. NPDC002965 TaxID=3154775 RepID=UPI0033ABBC1A
MTLTQTDHTDLGTLIGYALQPTQRPGRSPEYRRLLGRYRSEPQFRTAADAVLHGLGARVLSDGDFGLVLGVEPESPFAFRVTDMPNAGTRTGRLLAGLVLVGIAAYAYPSPAELDEERIRRVPDTEFEQWMRTLCERLQVVDAAGETIPEEGLDEAWRVYHELPSTLVGDRGRGSGRLSPKCTLYWVRNTLGWLVEQGMARTDGTDGAWILTERFRVQVKDMASEPAYTFLAALARSEGPATAAVTSGNDDHTTEEK